MDHTSKHTGRRLKMQVHYDKRGKLFELFRDNDIRMAYCVTISPGRARDFEQWHAHWYKTEWFSPIIGKGRIARKTLHDLCIDDLDGDNPYQVCVPPFTKHSVINDGNTPLVLIVLVDKLYDGSDERREDMDGFRWEKYPAE